MTDRGQSTLEYVFLIGVATMVLVYMGGDFKRGIQSAVKVTADQLGNQVNADQDFTSVDRSGILINSVSNSWVSRQNLSNEVNGVANPKMGEFTETFTNTYTNVSGPSN